MWQNQLSDDGRFLEVFTERHGLELSIDEFSASTCHYEEHQC